MAVYGRAWPCMAVSPLTGGIILKNADPPLDDFNLTITWDDGGGPCKCIEAWEVHDLSVCGWDLSVGGWDLSCPVDGTSNLFPSYVVGLHVVAT